MKGKKLFNISTNHENDFVNCSHSKQWIVSKTFKMRGAVNLAVGK